MEEFNQGLQQLVEVATSPMARRILQAVVCLLCIFCMGNVLYYRKRRKWSVLYFVLLCAAVLLWAGGSLLAGYAFAVLGGTIRLVGIVFVPALICLHIWKQVSYKEITLPVIVTALAVPVGLTCFIVYSTLFQGAPPNLISAFGLPQVLFLGYTVVALLRAYLLCMNVFYQMPRHMRKSTYTMLSGLTVFTFLSLAFIAWTRTPDYDVLLLAITIALYCFFEAFGKLSSADVIVTSRDFVFGSLGTTVLALSMGGRILDWNKKGAARNKNLPVPRYKERFESYRKRMIKEGNGRVSPHDDNLITTFGDGAERHYLISVREVSSRQRSYGYLVEISEVTQLYTKFRYLEEIAVVDQLTGLYNRNTYINTVGKLMAADKMPLVIIVGDVNKLKQLNDTHGHLSGDSLLVTVANAIKGSLPQTSMAYRIGGDEFVVLMPVGTISLARHFIEAVNGELSGINDKYFGTPSVSWGYAVITNEKQDYNEVFAQADKMMYAVKKATHQFKSSGLVPTENPAPEEGGEAEMGGPAAAQKLQ